MPDTTDLRRCIGSARYGIEAHEAPACEFPVQKSQKDGLGRMCRSHWNQYTAGLARDAKARRAAAGGEEPAPTKRTARVGGRPPKPEPIKVRHSRRGRTGGPVGYLGSEPGGPVEILPGGRRRRIVEVTPDAAPAGEA